MPPREQIKIPDVWAHLSIAILEQAKSDYLFIQKHAGLELKSNKNRERMRHLDSVPCPIAYLGRDNEAVNYLKSQKVICNSVKGWWKENA